MPPRRLEYRRLLVQVLRQGEPAVHVCLRLVLRALALEDEGVESSEPAQVAAMQGSQQDDDEHDRESSYVNTSSAEGDHDHLREYDELPTAEFEGQPFFESEVDSTSYSCRRACYFLVEQPGGFRIRLRRTSAETSDVYGKSLRCSTSVLVHLALFDVESLTHGLARLSCCCTLTRLVSLP